jgi:transposase
MGRQRFVIPEADVVVAGLQEEIRRSEEARYDHRLHAVLLVAQGMSGPEVARRLDEPVRTVQSWVRRFLDEGLPGLREAERSGRPRKLTDAQYDELEDVLRSTPSKYGLEGNLWDGKTLSAFIKKRWKIELGVRQCQRIFRQLGFRLRTPRPEVAGADPMAKAVFKKT